MNLKKNNTLEWNGKYLGIHYQIRKHLVGGEIEWTYVMFIDLELLPKPVADEFWLKPNTDDKGRVWYPLGKIPKAGFLELPNGLSSYNKVSGNDGGWRIIWIGGDYTHSWNEGTTYYQDDIAMDVERAIQGFRSMFEYKYRCRGNGQIYDLREGLIFNGSFASKEYFGDQEWYQKLELELKSITQSG